MTDRTPTQPPYRGALLATHTNYATAREALLTSIWLPDKSTWYTAQHPTFVRLSISDTLTWRGLVPHATATQLFQRHDLHRLPDNTSSSNHTHVHRFRVLPQVVQDIRHRVYQEEEHRQQMLANNQKVVSRLVSNVGGYHGPTEDLRAQTPDDAVSWCTPMLDVIQLALRSIQSCPGVDDTEMHMGCPEENKSPDRGHEVTGWMNISTCFDFNSVHDHGTAEWSFVYYVDVPSMPSSNTHKQTGGEVTGNGMLEEDDEDDDDDDDDDDVLDGGDGRLLLRTQVTRGKHHYGYFAIDPKPGDLWAFPGRTLHAVLPSKLKSVAAAHEKTNGSSRGRRISLAINCVNKEKEQKHVVSQLKPLYSEALLASIGLQ
jgi:hypothetical protein